MTLFARSDINEVTVSPAHGGCGATHHRPIVDMDFVDDYGHPQVLFDKTFALNCPRCEPFLSSEPTWAKFEADTPLTPDEQRIADREAQTGTALMTQMASAMANAAGQAVREMGGPDRLVSAIR